MATFKIILGSGTTCGPSYLRGAARSKVCENIRKTGSVDQYRSSVAKDNMKPGDKTPAFLQSSHVLHVAQSEERKKKFCDKNPLLALDYMKEITHINSIHDIGLNPFYINFWTSQQIHAYKLASKGSITVCLDATGLSLQKIPRASKSTKKSLFLYVLR